MKWLVKEFSSLTKISVRTLHHYDEIGLLKPSLRSASNYRLYSQDDLLKLERIVALKFFGYNLQQIKELVGGNDDIVPHLKAQQQQLIGQMEQLRRATEAIDRFVAAAAAGSPIDWSDIIKLIEVFRMAQNLKKTWAGQVYNDNELQQFAQLRERYSDEQMADYSKRWEKLIAKVKNSLDLDPVSPEVQRLAKEWMDLVDEVYGGHPDLKKALSSAYKHDKIPGAPFDAKLYEFIEQACKHAAKQKA